MEQWGVEDPLAPGSTASGVHLTPLWPSGFGRLQPSHGLMY